MARKIYIYIDHGDVEYVSRNLLTLARVWYKERTNINGCRPNIQEWSLDKRFGVRYLEDQEIQDVINKYGGEPYSYQKGK